MKEGFAQRFKRIQFDTSAFLGSARRDRTRVLV